MLANTASPPVNRAIMTGKDVGQGQPTVEYVYRHLTIYGYSAATFQLRDPHEIGAQTVVESM